MNENKYVKICSCEFPDGLLYDMENFVWVKAEVR